MAEKSHHERQKSRNETVGAVVGVNEVAGNRAKRRGGLEGDRRQRGAGVRSRRGEGKWG
jgi:hypothetical protein